MQTDWQKEEKTLVMSSAWPTKHEFQRPLIISNLQVWPLETNVVQQAPKTGPPLPSNVRLQMQLYGNKEGTLQCSECGLYQFYHEEFLVRCYYGS